MDNSWVIDSLCGQIIGNDKKKLKRLNFYSDEKRVQRKCQAICAECPVRRECIERALRDAEVWGVWGGATDEERRNVLGVDEELNTHDYGLPVICLYCRSDGLAVVEKKRTRVTLRCTDCNLTWKRRRMIKPRGPRASI